MSWKQWGIGEVVEAGDFQSFVQDQVVQSYANAAARGSALGTAVTDGMISFLQDGRSLSAYSTAAGAWVGIAPQSPNYLINGAMEINQRGDTTGASGYQFDRWRMISAGAGTFSVSSQSFTDDCPVPSWDFGNYLRIVTSGGDATTAHLFRQAVENVATLSEQTVTLSFYAKASSTANVAVSVRQVFGTGGSATVEINAGKVAVTTSWARYSVTFTVPSVSGKTIGAGNKLEPQIWVNGGSNFNAVTNSLGNQSGTFDFWGVQLEAGSVATPFRRAANTLQGELAACQRYYFRASSSATAQAIGFANGISTTTTNARIFVKTPVTMRVAPTSVEFANLGISDKTNYTLAVSAITIAQSQQDVVDLSVTNATGATALRTAILVANASASAFLGISAEL